MKNKSMLIVIALCAVLQSGNIVGSEGRQGWGAWLMNKMYGGRSVVKAHAEQGYSPMTQGAKGFALAGASFGMQAPSAIKYLLDPQAYWFYKRDAIMGIITMGAAGVAVAILQGIVNSYGQGYIDYDNAVAQTENTLIQALANSLKWPTPWSKMQAVQTRSVVSFNKNRKIGEAPEEDTRGIISDAYNKVHQAIRQELDSVSVNQRSIYARIDNEMGRIRRDLASIPNLEDQVSKLREGGVGQIFSMLEDPLMKAKIAIYSELVGKLTTKHSLSEEDLTKQARETGKLMSAEALVKRKEERARHARAEHMIQRGRGEFTSFDPVVNPLTNKFE